VYQNEISTPKIQGKQNKVLTSFNLTTEIEKNHHAINQAIPSYYSAAALYKKLI